MQIGLFSFHTEYTMAPDQLAREAEARGFESLWLPEHTHIPVPEDGGDVVLDPTGGVLPVEYRHMSDPFVGLAAAAAVTTTLKLGTAICLINQHHPIVLAKQVSTLDRISRGRFLFGVGAGWNKVEMAHHGVDFDDRWSQVRERIEALRTLWREERPGFDGRFVKFAPSFQYPKPVQQPHPPIVLGTLDTPFGRAQVAKHGDGWLPLTFSVKRTKASIDDVKARMRALGRDPDALQVSMFMLEDRERTVDELRAARDTGVARAIVRLPVADDDAVLRRLDALAAVQRALANG
jgi:probable F420-dependent oxidoreductase